MSTRTLSQLPIQCQSRDMFELWQMKKNCHDLDFADTMPNVVSFEVVTYRGGLLGLVRLIN